MTILEFAHVAGPVVRAQGGERLLRSSHARARTGGHLRQRLAGQERYICLRSREGPHKEGHYIEGLDQDPRGRIGPALPAPISSSRFLSFRRDLEAIRTCIVRSKTVSQFGRHSGILLPSYGESGYEGFYFQNLGYYWAINQYMDLTYKETYTTHGSWAIRPSLRYTKRYKYTGSIRFGYSLNRIGSQDAPDFSKQKRFRISLDPFPGPESTSQSQPSPQMLILSATHTTNILSTSVQNYLSNTFTSSVNYATNFGGKVYLNLNFNHSQNTLSKQSALFFPRSHCR